MSNRACLPNRVTRLLIVAFFSVLVALSSSSGSNSDVNLSTSELAQPVAAPAAPVRKLVANIGSEAFASMMFTPTVTATKVDSLFVDGNSNSKADPGDTLKYTVVISASGMDATGVTLTDMIDANTTLVPNSVQVTPLAIADSYSAVGNVRIQVPAANGVLANDFLGVPSATLSTTGSFTSAQNGNVTLNADGSFSYNPAPGFEGTDTFTYTLTNAAGNDTGTVSISVSGMIWFIDNSAGVNGDGRLTSPFNSLPNFVSGAADGPGDNIFLYRQTSTNYAGPLTLLASQKLIGQGATASLSSITGLTPPALSDPFPATGGTRPIIAASVTNLTLSTGNLMRGLDLSNTGGTALTGTNFSSFTASEASVTNTNGSGVLLSHTSGTGSLNVTFTKVSSANGSNGIFLNNTTGSFTVTGTGTAASGGTINNTSGADGATAGNGVYLNSATNVSLSRMQINDHPNFGIRGISVTGFTLADSIINGTNGNNTAFDEDSVGFDNLLGSASITNCTITGGFEDGMRVTNNTGTLNRLTVTNTTFATVTGGSSNSAISFVANSTAVVNVTIQNSFATTGQAAQAQFILNNASQMDLVFTGNTLTNNHPTIVSNGGGFLLAGTADADCTYNIASNSFRDSSTTALVVDFGGNAGSSSVGRIENNTIGVAGVANSGSKAGGGVGYFVDSAGGGVHTTLINNNIIRQYNNHGILIQVGDVQGIATTVNASITNNNINTPGNINTDFNGVHLNHGTVGADSFTSCIHISGNNLTGAGSGTTSPNNNDLRLRQRQATTVRLPGYGGANNDNAAVQTFLAGQNTLGTVNASNTVPTGGGYIGGAACTQPPAAMSVVAAFSMQMQRQLEAAKDAGQPAAYRDTLLAPEANTDNPEVWQLTQPELDLIVSVALARLQSLGVDEGDMERLGAVTFEIADLPDDELAVTTPEKIIIDSNGAGHGWFTDATPEDDEEFTVDAARQLKASHTSLAQDHMDLLSAVIRGLDYVLEHQWRKHSLTYVNLMQKTLPPSRRFATVGTVQRPIAPPEPVRVNDGSQLQSLGAAKSKAREIVNSPTLAPGTPTGRGQYRALRMSGTGGLSKHVNYAMLTTMSGETVTQSVGTLPAAKSVTIFFQVTVNNPFPNGVCSVSNQGTVSGGNFSSVLTDDPDVVGSANPTVTNIVIPPTITCPSDITTNTDNGVCTATVNYSTTTTGCPVPTVTCLPIASGGSFPKGITTVTCTATNSEGSAMCSFTVTVNDNQAPTLTCPSNISQSTDPDVCTAAVTFTTTITDNCPGATFTCTPATGSTFPKGTTTVNCTGQDAVGNPATPCSFSVTVNDTQAPSVGPCPSPVVVSNDTGLCSAIVMYTTPPATDNCPPTTPTVACSPPSGSAFPKGTTTVTCSATDASGNPGSCSFTVTVNDTEAPVITCPASGGAFAASSDCLPPANSAYTGSQTASYSAGAETFANPILFNFSACNAPPASMAGANTTDTFNGVVRGMLAISPNPATAIQAPASLTVKTTFNNTSGNTRTFDTEMLSLSLSGGNLPAGVMIRESPTLQSTGQTKITSLSPSGFHADSFFDIFTEISTDGGQSWSPADMALHVTMVQTTDPNACDASVSYIPVTATDNCPGVGTPSCSPASGTTFAKGVTTVSCSVMDAVGNSSNCSFTVTVIDGQLPSLTCPSNITVDESSPGSGSATVTYTTPTATDNCTPAPTVSCDPASGSAFPVGITTVTCTATDSSENTNECTFTVQVDALCALTCNTDITTTTDPGLCTAVVTYSQPTVSGSCGTVTCSPASGTAFAKGVTTVTCTSTVGPSCSFTVTVNDTQPPSITCPPNQLAPPGVVNYPAAVATDNCPGVTASCNPPSGSSFPLGFTTVTCTATDTAGNASSCSFQVITFDVAIVDDSTGASIFINTMTGDYMICCGGMTISGKGTISIKGCYVTLTDNRTDRRVLATFDTCRKTGKATIQMPPGVVKCTITDRNTVNSIVGPCGN